MKRTRNMEGMSERKRNMKCNTQLLVQRKRSRTLNNFRICIGRGNGICR